MAQSLWTLQRGRTSCLTHASSFLKEKISTKGSHLMMNVIQSSQYIIQHATHVSVPESGVKGAADKLRIAIRENSNSFRLSRWREHPLNPSIANEHAAEWIFLIDLLNFCFWARDGSQLFAVDYQHQVYTGYWSLCAAINRADIPSQSSDASPWQLIADISDERWASEIFLSCSDGKVPLLEERVRVVRQAANILLSRFDGYFRNCITEANGSAVSLVSLIVENFPSFRDEAMFNGQNVKFYKRAQIVVADLWACFEGGGLGLFADIEKITMFPDYRVPQILLHLGALQYSDELMNRLRQNPYLENGDPLEVEIRGGSVWAVEQLRLQLLAQGVALNAIQLDFYLWDEAKRLDLSHLPIHKTTSHFY